LIVKDYGIVIGALSYTLYPSTWDRFVSLSTL